MKVIVWNNQVGYKNQDPSEISPEKQVVGLATIIIVNWQRKQA